MNLLGKKLFWLDLACACVIAILAATPVLMSGVMDRGFEIAKLSLAEPAVFFALGAALLGCGWRWIRDPGLATRVAMASIAAFLLVAAVSTLFSGNPEVAIFGGYYRREGFLAWCVYGAFFLAVLALSRRAGRIEGLLDVLLLASIVPAAYAIQQRLDLDFYFVVHRELTRPGSTLGSPLYLAAYMGVLFPLALVRCWQERRNFPDLFVWLAVAAMQITALLLTQTRGPLLALIAGVLLLACLAGGHARARRVFFGAAAVSGIVVALLVAINTLSGMKELAQETPVARRLVFDLQREAGDETRNASSSAAVRLSIWAAGGETFVAAPVDRKLLGYGPESAYLQYFPHVPASVMQLIGYDEYETYDRLHADTLDIGLNFGLLAWLAYALFFAAVFFAAARALFLTGDNERPWKFALFALAGGGAGASAAIASGLAAAVAPAFGVGLGAGVMAFYVRGALRTLKYGQPAMSAAQIRQWELLAGLTAALLVFWLDAQVNIPVLTTRLISFAIAALILSIAEKLVFAAKHSPLVPQADDNWPRLCGIAVVLVAGCASCLPAGLFDAAAGSRWGLRVLPLAVFLPVALWAVWVHGRRCDRQSAGARYWLAAAVGMPLLYAAVHYALSVNPGAAPALAHIRSISIVSFAGPAFILTMCLVAAAIAERSQPVNGSDIPVSLAGRSAAVMVVAVALLIAACDFRAVRADVAYRLATQAPASQLQLREQLMAEAIRILPYERYYRRQMGFDLLGRAVAEIRVLNAATQPVADAAARVSAVVRDLNAAEVAARTALQLFPGDPWAIGNLANVLQIMALRVLRPLDPNGGLNAAREANELFAQAHLMFPSQPLILRNWAQLMADQGNIPDAYRLLDLMEKLVPKDLQPYAERIVMARQVSDYKTIEDTLSRAERVLAQSQFRQLLDVAQVQQK